MLEILLLPTEMIFRVDIVQAQRTQAVLEYMVSQGSHIAFFIREEI